MSELRIITNNVPRLLLYGYELPDKVKSDFDYLDDIDSGDFVKYRGSYYDINEFMRISDTAPELLQEWDGYSSDSFFSGIVIRYPRDEYGELEDTDYIVCGHYLS